MIVVFLFESNLYNKDNVLRYIVICACFFLLGVATITYADDITPHSKQYKLYQDAMQGNADALYYLGFAYFDGDGVPKDNVKSYAYVHLASALSNRAVRHILDKIKAELSPEQLTDAKTLADDLWVKLPKN